MELADEKYVSEADPTKPKNKRTRLAFAIIAAVLCTVIVSLSLVMMIMHITNGGTAANGNEDELSPYADSEYYEIITRLKKYESKTTAQNLNLFALLFGGFKSAAEDELIMEDAMAGAPNVNFNGAPGAMVPSLDGGNAEGATGSVGGSSYVEVTDNQVAGVIEADLIKRTTTHIFYLDGNTLRAYSIDGEDSAEVGNFYLSTSGYYTQFYLSADGKTAYMMAPSYTNRTTLDIISVDISDPTAMRENGVLTIAGDHISTRYVDGEFIVMTRFTPVIDFDDISNFVPTATTPSGEICPVAAKDIIYPDELSSPMYTTIFRVSPEDLSIIDSTALLSYVGSVYVSKDNIFAARQFYQSIKDGNKTTSMTSTEIAGISYSGDGLEHLGNITIDGYIKDQYSMDEKDGILRVVTTTDKSSYIEESGNGMSSVTMVDRNGTNASLWCVELSSWTLKASVENFAPWGETVRSVRFDGNSAYVCTAIQTTDPVFFFDLSDITSISYKETGYLEGFSTSLINFADGYLLGVGVNANNYLKIEVYEEGEKDVESVCKYELDYSYSSGDYKSYYVDRENGLLGLGVMNYSSNASSEYIVLHFEDRALTEVIRTRLGNGDIAKDRGVYVDGYFYMFGSNDFKVMPIDLNA